MKSKCFVLGMLVLFVALAWVSSVMAADIPRITKEELKAMMDNPKVIIVDVRTNAGWSESKLKIKGAVREDPSKVKSWIEKYPFDKTYVFYCS
jgi:rhodanese-related sulfurtransferase